MLDKFFNVKKKEIPGGLWTKCPNCSNAIYTRELNDNLKVCHHCNYHFRLTVQERIDITFDNFEEMFSGILPVDSLNFVDTMPYSERLKEAQSKTLKEEAIIVGVGTIGDKKIAVGILDFDFIGGSMGSVVGEKIFRITNYAREKRLALVLFSASGGARMQEGMFSLMQMAKTAMVIGKYKESGGFYISCLLHPTTGGVSASFATLGDVIIAEPGALIGFAGPRVIEQTIRQKLPQGFQRSEYLLEHGMIDAVIERKAIKETLNKLVSWHGY
ncbi:acetyl-CoA carboxylase carboxyl transferase subunit beta [Thermodesulfobium acidiphilum]|uniref:Acetyl-coenzyme A carboxylase carboxyl transferase subunit beta n=1 Tax=Thermodesulfobium acidiphilum TaxID=1794699 RepID=A0A2R4W1I8_THEAF|nr:acetyl-CoA carboxylase, carboxyltransferase subunit beta [Thermodesulfobium acidiphilum]AWB10671.1 acetyl-CoA carboxylase carboxyl transferase subunit beta [Thermodesulfobium acidiphilum]PMP85267.1 MAG: acetyl-CoA carboxylase carboxyl transferase subunit beta [Thermodesulfobium narugense]